MALHLNTPTYSRSSSRNSNVSKFELIYLFFSSFVNRHDEAFSTEPLKNNGKGASLNFYHVQNITVTVTRSFIEYMKSQPMIFEVYGHYQQHPLHKVTPKHLILSLLVILKVSQQDPVTSCGGPRPPPRRLLPPAIPISQPVRSSKDRATTCPATSHLHSKHDLIVWFEILELGNDRLIVKLGFIFSFQPRLASMSQS